jgi:hypothetical protein
VNDAEVRHFRRAAEFPRLDLPERREDGRHRDVEPRVDRPEIGLGVVGGLLDRGGVGDVGGKRERAAAACLDLDGGCGEPFLAPGEQSDRCTAVGKRSRQRTADAGRRAGDDADGARPDLQRVHERCLPCNGDSKRSRRDRPSALRPAGARSVLSALGIQLVGATRLA